MATAIHYVRRNFEYQLTQITPTYGRINRGFASQNMMRFADQLNADATNNNTGHARDFTVRWLESDQDKRPTDMSMREAWHLFSLRVNYPTCIGNEENLHDIILQDRHQICERLRDSQYFVGYKGAPSDAIGLHNRFRVEDRLDDAGPVWAIIFHFRCFIREIV